MAEVDLGIVRDKILGITRISGDGSAGVTDVYKMTSELSPDGFGNFSVRNGADAISGYHTVSVQGTGDVSTTTASLVTEINNVGPQNAIGIMHLHMDYNGSTLVGVESTSLRYEYSYDYQTYDSPSLDTPIDGVSLFSDSALTYSADDYFYILYFAPNENNLVIDNTLDENSSNPVENSVITQALASKMDIVTIDSAITFQDLAATYGDGTYAAIICRITYPTVATPTGRLGILGLSYGGGNYRWEWEDLSTFARRSGTALQSADVPTTIVGADESEYCLLSSLANPFVANTVYIGGQDIVYHDQKLYKRAGTGSESSWDASKWTEVKLQDLL